MSSNQRNYSGLFNLFAGNDTDRTSAFLERVGKISFTITFVVAALSVLIKDSNSGLYTIMVVLYGGSFIIGILAFIVTGIRHMGREKGKTNFLSSSVYVLRNTFMFLFLPAALITVLLIIWAIVTKQPGVR